MSLDLYTYARSCEISLRLSVYAKSNQGIHVRFSWNSLVIISKVYGKRRQWTDAILTKTLELAYVAIHVGLGFTWSETKGHITS